ncbi:hypothetical protein J6590_053927 [Homalodisca vitripennis]|nr:hypothetical protein J6590_053927 [Homalodisca vitripennis]
MYGTFTNRLIQGKGKGGTLRKDITVLVGVHVQYFSCSLCTGWALPQDSYIDNWSGTSALDTAIWRYGYHSYCTTSLSECLSQQQSVKYHQAITTRTLNLTVRTICLRQSGTSALDTAICRYGYHSYCTTSLSECLSQVYNLPIHRSLHSRGPVGVARHATSPSTLFTYGVSQEFTVPVYNSVTIILQAYFFLPLSG